MAVRMAVYSRSGCNKVSRANTYGRGSVYQRSGGKWVASLEVGWTSRGTRRRLTRTRATKKAAQVALRDMERDLADAGVPDEDTVANQSTKAWFEQWLENTETALAPSSWATNRSAVNQWIVPTIGHVQVSRLGAQHIRQVMKAVLDAGRAPSTAVRAHSVLTKGLSAALQEGRRISSAVFHVPAPNAGESERDAIPLDDALLILAAALDTEHAARWVAALLQALRPAEARGLTWDAVDFEAETIDISWQLKPLPYKVKGDRESGFRVPTGYETKHLVDAYHLVRPKTRSGRRLIPMVPWMKAALMDWRGKQAGPNPHGLLWPAKDGRPLTDKQDRVAWRELLTAAEVSAYDLYAARHTTATLLRRAGVDDETIVAIMGHASILSTRAYLHTDTERARQALEKVAATLQLEG